MKWDLSSKVVQVAYVVPDLEEACGAFHRLYGIGPFVGGEGVRTLEEHVYREEAAAPIAFRGVFVQSGDLNIELIELVSTTDSAFHDMARGMAGPFVHHVAMFCEDYAGTRDAYVAKGFAVASAFKTGFGAEICYIDARAATGHMLELYPEDATIRAMYRATVAAARAWDGRELIIPWDRAMALLAEG
ncbi:VOC family protein [Novosphingobium sp. Chol11]|uniref:VOC family protein n=1 Tax=Novosphingobium sp. Chol11 TaxID=1385763 RepID=UPI0025CC4913|nr:VOC family protein [Novosphingobium sp. Chol11]